MSAPTNPPSSGSSISGLTPLRVIQSEVETWQQYNFGDSNAAMIPVSEVQAFFGMVEELGELAHAMLKSWQGIRGFANDPAKLQAAKEDAVADLFVFALNFCNQHNIDAHAVLDYTWNKEVKPRNFRRYPKNGRTE